MLIAFYAVHKVFRQSSSISLCIFNNAYNQDDKSWKRILYLSSICLIRWESSVDAFWVL